MNRIKDIREDKDISQKELAKKLNIARTTLSGYERQISEPPFEILIKISKIFNVSVDYIICKTNNPSNDSFTEGLTEEEIQELIKYRELLKLKRKVENNKMISTLIKEK